MVSAEYDVVIARDAMSVYNFLLHPSNLPSWQAGIRSVELESGAEGAKGAIYRQILTGPGGRPVAADFELIETRPGAEIQYQVIAGPERPHGGYYLSTEGCNTRVRFALQSRPRGFWDRMTTAFGRRVRNEVGQLEQLKIVLEKIPRAG